MIVTAIILGITAFALFVIEHAGGRNFVTQPIIVGFIVGLVMGDLKTGITVGATLELAFLGATSVGAVIPPDAMTGSLLGVAFVIYAGASAESALILALPIATLVLIFKNFYYGYIVSLFVRKADKYAEAGDYKGIERIHWMTGLGMALMIGVLVAVSFAAGSDAMSRLLNAIPGFVQTGLNVMVGLLPAIGFSMLARTMLNKSNVHIFLCGFALVAYSKLPILGVAIFGVVLALIIVQMEKEKTTVVAGGVDNEF
ncbi:MAG: PTS sugar transporter subunit IIC [Herbinix sp.]|nr:PTS sugar transporter subunit IIC [Herbinix sp.]